MKATAPGLTGCEITRDSSCEGLLRVVIAFMPAYRQTANQYLPTTMCRPAAHAILAFAPRSMDWTTTVPLLTTDLLAAQMISGRAPFRTQWAPGSASSPTTPRPALLPRLATRLLRLATPLLLRSVRLICPGVYMLQIVTFVNDWTPTM